MANDDTPPLLNGWILPQLKELIRAIESGEVTAQSFQKQQNVNASDLEHRKGDVKYTIQASMTLDPSDQDQWALVRQLVRRHLQGKTYTIASGYTQNHTPSEIEALCRPWGAVYTDSYVTANVIFYDTPPPDEELDALYQTSPAAHVDYIQLTAAVKTKIQTTGTY